MQRTCEHHWGFVPDQTIGVPVMWRGKALVAFAVSNQNRFHQIWAGATGINHQANVRVALGRGRVPRWTTSPTNSDQFLIAGDLDVIEMPIRLEGSGGGTRNIDSQNSMQNVGQNFWNTGPFYAWVTSSDGLPYIQRVYMIEQPTDWIALLADVDGTSGGNFRISAFLAAISSNRPPYMNHEQHFFGR